jgi:predicted ATPase
VHVRQVLGLSNVESRFEARHTTGNVGPILGRSEELEILRRRWEHVAQGSSREVLITGEPGIGKSRLARSPKDWLSSEDHIELTYHCSPHHQNSTLYPVISQFVRAAGIKPDDKSEIRLTKLRTLLM